MNHEVLNLLIRIATDMNLSLPHHIEVEKGADAQLFGAGAPLDSMALVQFVVEVEAEMEDTFGASIVLANERAMSQRRSPFLTLGTLAEYIGTLLNETNETAA
jgi:D-alanine--poly(phosphoribitol) ligase subunit 2